MSETRTEITAPRAMHETGIAAATAREQTRIQARYIMAAQRPRNFDDFRVRLLKRCDSSDFAAVARYAVPRGGKPICGPSIKFVRDAIRFFGNAGLSSEVLYDDHEKRLIRCEAIDYESGASWEATIVLTKTIERSSLKEGERPLSSRTNSQGKTVYTLPATDDDIFMRQNALVSKTLRNLGLDILPSDVVEEAQRKIIATMESEVDRDPDAARKLLVDSFASVGVSAAQLADYLGGRALDALSPAELVELRALYAAIQAQELRWPEAFEASPFRTNSAAPANDANDAAAKARAATRAKLAARAEKLKKPGATVEAKSEQKSEPKPEERKPVPGVDEPPADYESK